MAAWIRRDYSKAAIDRAAKLVLPWWAHNAPEPPGQELAQAFMVIQNWRTSHALPLLTFRMGLSNRARRIEPGAIIAQRLKRVSSVLNKLAREPHMQLSQMQDLGGCRAILSNLDGVEHVYNLYRGDPGLFESEGTLKCYDYIRAPKPDGYRGIHVVGRYNARLKKNAPWNGHRIEIQLRSQLQHAFATAVETATTFTQEPLKFGAGPERWRRFFSLVGSAFAMREGTALVPETPAVKKELISELKELTKALKVRQRLRGWTNAIKQLPRHNITGASWLLLVLDVHENTIQVTGYRDVKRAAEAVAEIERSGYSTKLDAVVVRVGSIRDLHHAYPNYYADTKAFLDSLTTALQ